MPSDVLQRISLRKHPFLLALRRETSPAAKSEEKRMFSQASSSVDSKKIVVSRMAVTPTEAKHEHLSEKLRPKRLHTTGRLRWISCNLRDNSVTAPLYPLRVALAFQPLFLGCLYRFLLRQIFP